MWCFALSQLDFLPVQGRAVRFLGPGESFLGDFWDVAQHVETALLKVTLFLPNNLKCAFMQHFDLGVEDFWAPLLGSVMNIKLNKDWGSFGPPVVALVFLPADVVTLGKKKPVRSHGWFEPGKCIWGGKYPSWLCPFHKYGIASTRRRGEKMGFISLC